MKYRQYLIKSYPQNSQDSEYIIAICEDSVEHAIHSLLGSILPPGLYNNAEISINPDKSISGLGVIYEVYFPNVNETKVYVIK